ncbi:MAG: hypothetical protein OER97_08340 [Gammaproteobacteria bacterium]|nr:hypothetical protein [Gammaproteobacteria bacterium]
MVYLPQARRLGVTTILDILFSWDDALRYGMDVLVYLVMALVGTTFFIIRLVLALFFGGDGDVDGDLADVGGDGAFNMFSILSILAFFMGAGWMGLTCRIDWDLNGMVSAAAATGFGFVLMMMASGLMAFARKLNRTVDYDTSTAVGRIATAYMSIPMKGEGRGKIQVSVSGRLKTMDAISVGPRIPEFSSVKVISVRDDGTFVVEPAD